MKKKRKYALIAILMFVLLMTGCGKTEKDPETEPKEETAEQVQEEAVDEDEEAPSEEKILVAYFSATGTTKGVAEMIATIEGADIYEILPTEPYSDADRDWHDSESRTSKEQNDPESRPEIASDTIDISGYSKIYIGYPIWWGEAPRIMNTFVEAYDFGDATIIPFCTSGSSGIGSSATNLAKLAGSGNWMEGERFSGSASEEDIANWINTLGV